MIRFKLGVWIGLGVAVLALLGIAVSTFEVPRPLVVQQGFRGTGMDQLYNPSVYSTLAAANAVPAPLEAAPSSGPRAGQLYRNLQVLGHLSVGELARTMVAMTAWVSPDQGCNYCHVGANFADDSLYTKVVARRMLQMTMHINSEQQAHVGATGVTCYTCHRGQPVPANTWSENPGPMRAAGMSASNAGQNLAAPVVGGTSLPFDPFSAFLASAPADIRVQGQAPLAGANNHSIKQTEWTYGLMMHFSQGLGVNCTFCHNSRSFSSWEESNPRRGVAWHGIRMVRDLNVNYVAPLQSVLPAAHRGPQGDALKVNCTTCHQGAFRPLLGASMLQDYPQLARPGP
jgi:photosynthetic reaction center cytochrome c subunit